jgi:shikimate kinase
VTSARNDRPRRLWLIGMMGCGKSAVGNLLSPLIGWPYVDNDETLVAREGLDLVDLAHDSPERLHDAELAMVRSLAAREPPLIAGIPASLADHPAELGRLATSGLVVYLRATPETLVTRTAVTRRPFLDHDPLGWTARTLTRRAPDFERCADLIIDTDTPSAEQLARTLADFVAHAATNQQEPI